LIQLKSYFRALNLKKTVTEFGPKKGGVFFGVECATKNLEERCDIMLHPMWKKRIFLAN
jgi:hypothetical protein